ncbi:hypothetical protein HANVADRAFT_4544 [Hanseniaspora valbyensis NRRL Y-1626]|uniref:Uncharacterized protein n=1 Tax=Hanseniaspora valbyensis NRRL Y-1626 TaxID=766949 RepID=A0A1B7T7D1_9ASCO|nr:hypothetical protein HANVADRAFT_4544 [Hanseniaspora valbyensis NRRL Y-1626]
MPDETIIPKATTISGKISRHIMKQQFKSKGLALKDYGKSLERREYEQSLNLFPKPVGIETFLNHPQPLINSTNITAWNYDVERSKPEKVSSYDEEVPTIEYVKYVNSLSNPQILIPAWSVNDLLDLSFAITDDNGVSTDKKTVKKISLIQVTPARIKLPFFYDADVEYNGVDDLYLDVSLKRNSESCVKRFPSDDTCDIVITKRINLIEKFTDIDSQNNQEITTLYYNPKPLVQLIYNSGDLIVSQIEPNILENILADDFTGRKDNSSGIATRYFPFIQYDNFKHTKSELIQLESNKAIKLSLSLKFERENLIKWRLAMKITDYILRIFVSIPFTFVESRFHFNYKLDAFKMAIFETSKNEKIIQTALVILSSFSSILIFFQSEARFNGNVSANKSLIVILLNFVITTCLISNGFKYSLTAIGVLLADIICLFLRTNEQYHWRFYEPSDPKPTKFSYKKKFGLKELIAIDLYPKFNKDVLAQEANYLKNFGKQIFIFVALPLSTYLGGNSYESDGSVITFFTEILINTYADDLRLMPDETIIPKATTISGKISRHIMKQQFKSKGLALKDYGKSLERREYEQSLNLFPKPVGIETFLNHPQPLINSTNITAWNYDVERSKPEKVSSYDEEVPTIEYVKYVNSLSNPQILIPAWSVNDLLDLSFAITDDNGVSTDKKTNETAIFL